MSNIVHLPATSDPAKLLSELESTLPWLTSWKATDPVPASSVPMLPQAIEVAERVCARVTAREFGVLIDQLIGWIERSRLYAFSAAKVEAEKQAEELTRDYRIGLGDLPADLLRQAIGETMRTYNPKFSVIPKPAEIRAHVADELSRRRGLERSLKSALFVAAKLGRVEQDPYRVERTPTELAAAEEARKRAEQILADAKPMAMPTRREDLDEIDGVTDLRAAIRRVTEETRAARRISRTRTTNPTGDHPR